MQSESILHNWVSSKCASDEVGASGAENVRVEVARKISDVLFRLIGDLRMWPRRQKK